MSQFSRFDFVHRANKRSAAATTTTAATAAAATAVASIVKFERQLDPGNPHQCELHAVQPGSFILKNYTNGLTILL